RTVATSSAPAVSVTNPWGLGMTGSAATTALAVRARSASAARLRMDGVCRGHDALGVGQIARELLARPTRGAAAGAPAHLERAPEGGERTDHALTRGQHLVVAERGLVAAKVEHVAQDH